MTAGELPRILRRRGEAGAPTFLELFFDLVYIFMLSRLAAGLADDLSVRTFFETAVLLLAAWWVWVLTAWLTDLFDPRLTVIQAACLGSMLGTLLMAVSVPEAFGRDGWLFVAAYFGIHVVRDATLIPGTRVNRYIQARSVRVFFWFLVTAPLWVGGVFADDTVRLVLWGVAAAVDLGSARLGWPTPKLGRTELASQIFTGMHLSERHREIFIIALGELILSAGMELHLRNFTPGAVTACALTFGSTVLLFLLYFHRVRHLLAPHRVSSVERVKPGTSTSYSHLVMVGGVLLVSTGTSLVVGDPDRDPPLSWVLILLGGPALFLLGTVLFEIVVTGRLLGTRVTAIVVLAASGPAMPLLPSLAVMAVPTFVLLGTLVVELAVNRAGATAESSPRRSAPPQ